MDEETYEYLIPIVIIIIIITIVCIYKNIYSSNNIPKIIHQTYPTNQVNKDIQTNIDTLKQILCRHSPYRNNVPSYHRQLWPLQ